MNIKMEKEYGFLNSIVIDLTNDIFTKINKLEFNGEQKKVPYKEQYIIEEIIKILESKV